MLENHEVFIAEDDKTGEGYEETINNLENGFDKIQRRLWRQMEMQKKHSLKPILRGYKK